MSDRTSLPPLARAQTDAVRRALADARDEGALGDLLFLERWEMTPIAGAAAALRVHQIRRANPELAAAVRAEIETARTGARRGA